MTRNGGDDEIVDDLFAVISEVSALSLLYRPPEFKLAYYICMIATVKNQLSSLQLMCSGIVLYTKE